jgi:hypothetical protein
MDKTVYIVGTPHRYQGTYTGGIASAGKEKLEQFKRFLEQIVREHDIHSIGEEMTVDALHQHPHPDLPPGESIPFQVAAHLIRPHKYCDRNLPETEREPYWLEQLRNFWRDLQGKGRNPFPCLFVLDPTMLLPFRLV